MQLTPPASFAHVVDSLRRVLILDDDQDSGEIAGVLVEHAGHEVRVVDAADLALVVAPVFHPDVAVIDIGLPGMDGYQLCAALRALPGLEGCWFVASTGHVGSEAIARSAAAGFDVHLGKPVMLDDLRRAFAGSSALYARHTSRKNRSRMRRARHTLFRIRK
jgi:CheY-like chemotaxis protein